MNNIDGVDFPVRAGYHATQNVALDNSYFDGQGHLNNAAIARVFNDMRITYVHEWIGRWWSQILYEESLVVALREMHISYESEGLPGEQFCVGMRYIRREAKAAIFEQELWEHATGRVVARGWGLQLLLQAGRVVDWPQRYFERVAEIEQQSIARIEKSARTWGPGGV